MWLLLSSKLQREGNRKMLLFIGLFYAEDNELQICNSKHFVDGKSSNILLYVFVSLLRNGTLTLYLELDTYAFSGLSRHPWDFWYDTSNMTATRAMHASALMYTRNQAFKKFYYPRPVLAFGYCRCLRLWVSVCLSVCVSITSLSAR